MWPRDNRTSDGAKPPIIAPGIIRCYPYRATAGVWEGIYGRKIGERAFGMTTIHFDAWPEDRTRRDRLYQGDLFVYGPTPETLAFKDFARKMVEDAFGGLDPEMAQYGMVVEDYARLLGELKPRFIHRPDSKAHIQKILSRFGCDVAATYFEVPKLRSSTSDNYLTAGIAYAWHPHRDTWYSAP